MANFSDIVEILYPVTNNTANQGGTKLVPSHLLNPGLKKSIEWSTFFNDQKEPQPVLPGRLQNLDSARRIYLKVQLSLCKPNIQQ